MNKQSTIAAIATPAGTGGIAVVRISGPRAIEIADSAWRGRSLAAMRSHSATLGNYISSDGSVLDQAVAIVYRAPKSYTGEDVVELSLHGSIWIQREVLSDLIKRGAHAAAPGEFTQRAFLNNRLDLAQAEGVADLIAASSKAAHRLAMTQTRGNFSKEFEALRLRLVEFASLLELELDFSEEDVEFADRSHLKTLASDILGKVERLAKSYSTGAVIKDGVPVVIAGVPNAGKSSLLNLLLDEDKAIVTDIPGTTRDIIEGTSEIDGILYRFIDTAGLRDSSDKVERIGIDRARAKMNNARIVIWIVDPTSPLPPQLDELRMFRKTNPDIDTIIVLGKSDLKPKDTGTSSKINDAITILLSEMPLSATTSQSDKKNTISFSALTGEGLSEIRQRLKDIATCGYDPQDELIVTNARHYEALTKGTLSLRRAIEGIDNGISADFIAQDVRETLHHLATVTGTVTTPDLLQTIFSRFCVGK